MIRFSYDPPHDAALAFEHFSLEGDNERGYVLLGWNDATERDNSRMLQAWFETLGEALDHCSIQFCIRRQDWHAPTVNPPVVNFERVTRGRRKGGSTILNADNVRDSQRRAQKRDASEG